MQQFTVPQFIDVEDKIIGPITARQFIILLIGFMIIVINYKIFDFSLFVVSSLMIFAISGIFSFAKINGRPFHYFVLNLMQTFKKPNLRVWNPVNKIHQDIEYDKNKNVIDQNIGVIRKIKPSSSHLNELSLIVDTQGAYKGEKKDDEVKITNIKK